MPGIFRVLNREQTRSLKNSDEQDSETETGCEPKTGKQQALRSDRLRRKVRGVDHFDSLTLLLLSRILVQGNLLLLQEKLIERSLLGLILAFDRAEGYFDARNMVDTIDKRGNVLFVGIQRCLLSLDLTVDIFDFILNGAGSQIRTRVVFLLFSRDVVFPLGDLLVHLSLDLLYLFRLGDYIRMFRFQLQFHARQLAFKLSLA